MTDGFNPCPLAVERNTDDLCEEVVTTSRVLHVDPWSDVEFQSCAACAAAYDHWIKNYEPCDEDIYNGPNVEGGISFRTEDTPAYRERLKDAGRLR